VTGLEAESPRGRIYLARAVAEERVEMTAAVQSHWDLCLQCRACEVACPSGVAYGRIMEHVRAQVAAAPAHGAGQRRWRRLVLRNVVARRRVLGVALALPRLYVGSPVRRMARALGLTRLLGPFGTAEAGLPRGQGRPLRPGDVLAAPDVEAGQAVVFTGCIMGELFGEVHRATGRVLARCGIQGLAAEGQVCCGALHAHDGDLDYARKLARTNVDALEPLNLPVVVNSAGCGAAMKEYGELLAGDPSYAERARRLALRVRDFSEYVAGLARPGGRFEARVTYQDACHLAHAQRIREQPRTLLAELDGCEMVETPGADVCCGAAGLYSLVQPAMSAELRSRKASQFKAAAADVVVTANPGCQMQYEAAIRATGLKARVMHIAQVLDQAYRRAD
jgi:glycolate oxidase iron-sulfur subunit